jgi:putative endopeptidase
VKQNGKLSAGEDTADNGGIHLTLGALRTSLKAQGKDFDTTVEDVVANMPEFAHAFGCHAGQPMVHANACRVW